MFLQVYVQYHLIFHPLVVNVPSYLMFCCHQIQNEVIFFHKMVKYLTVNMLMYLILHRFTAEIEAGCIWNFQQTEQQSLNIEGCQINHIIKTIALECQSSSGNRRATDCIKRTKTLPSKKNCHLLYVHSDSVAILIFWGLSATIREDWA